MSLLPLIYLSVLESTALAAARRVTASGATHAPIATTAGLKVLRIGFEKRAMAASDASDAAPSDAAPSDAAAAGVGEMIARLLEEALPLGPTSIS